MPVITDSVAEKADQYFGEFMTAYPTPEDIYRGAMAVAAANTHEPQTFLPDKTYISRYFLLACLGEGDQEFRASADYVYTLAEAAKDNFYYPAMVFRRGTPDDFYMKHKLPPELKIDYGVISNKDIEHFFSAELDPRKHIRRQGIKPRFLAHGVGIRVCKAQVIVPDLGMERCTVAPLNSGSLLTRFGTVSLEPEVEEDEPVYAVEERIAVIGKKNCQKIIEAIMRQCWDSDAQTLKSLELMANGHNLRP